MSLLVPELDQISSRILVIGADVQDLKNFFELLSFELTSDLGAQQKIDLAVASLAAGPLRYWTSFTLGRRADSDVRVSLMGTTIQDLQANPALLEVSEAIFAHINPASTELAQWLSLKIPFESRTQPLVITEQSPIDPTAPAADTFALNSVNEWAHRHFNQVRSLSSDEKFLAEGLEWVLSF